MNKVVRPHINRSGGSYNIVIVLRPGLHMENTKTMTVQLPEETYQRMRAYLKRHKVKQKAFVIGLVEDALKKKDAGSKDHP